MGDLNAKSSTFNQSKVNNNGTILDDTILRLNCQILNDNCDPTFHILRETGNYREVLDLFLKILDFYEEK